MDEAILNDARDQVSQGGKVVIGIIGDNHDVMNAAKEAATRWGSRAVSGDTGTAWYVRVKMGRPKKAEASAPSVVKAVRLPLALLEALQESARLQGLSLNAVLQIASAEWLMHHKRS